MIIIPWFEHKIKMYKINLHVHNDTSNGFDLKSQVIFVKSELSRKPSGNPDLNFLVYFLLSL